MVSGLLSIASFSSENTASCFGNVRGKLPALLLGLDGCWSQRSAISITMGHKSSDFHRQQ